MDLFVLFRPTLSKVGSAIAVLAVVTLASCTPPSRQPVPVPPAVETAGEPFAVAASRLSPGEQVVMSTPWGVNSVVLLEKEYLSGLGIPCRQVLVNSGGVVQRIAVCRAHSGWYAAEPVFEQTQR